MSSKNLAEYIDFRKSQKLPLLEINEIMALVDYDEWLESNRQMEKDVEATIKLFRFLTWHEGTFALSIFDGDGFQEATITAFLERSGLKIENKHLYTPEELKTALLNATNPHNLKQEEILNIYKARSWNEE